MYKGVRTTEGEVGWPENQCPLTVIDTLESSSNYERGLEHTIKNLLNPAGESQVMTEASDEKIFQSIMDAIEARENIDINGGDDVDNAGVAIEPRLTRHEVLKAVSTISKYINDELDDPVSCKIEGLLWSFNQQLHLDESVRGHQFSSQPRGPSLPGIRTIV